MRLSGDVLVRGTAANKGITLSQFFDMRALKKIVVDGADPRTLGTAPSDGSQQQQQQQQPATQSV